MAIVYERLGSQILPRYSEDIGLESIPHYDQYEDEMQNKWTFPQLAEELKSMPEVGNQYIGAEILLPRGHRVVMPIGML